MGPKVGRGFIFWALFALVAGSMPVSAQSTADLIWTEGQVGELKTWRVLETNLEDESASHQITGSWLDFSPYDNAIPQSLLLLEISATYTFEESSDGTWNFTVESDSFDISGCFWHVSTRNPGGFLAGDFIAYPSYQVQCATAVVIPEGSQFTIWLNRTVLTGSPDTPVDEHTTIKGDRGDFIVTGQPNDFELLTGVSGVEFLVFVVVIGLTIVLWSRSKDHIVQVFTGVMLMFFGAIAISLFASWPGWVPFGGAIGVLGGYLLIRSAIEWYQEA